MTNVSPLLHPSKQLWRSQERVTVSFMSHPPTEEGIKQCCDTSVRSSVRLCLCHAASSTTVHFTAIVTIEHAVGCENALNCCIAEKDYWPLESHRDFRYSPSFTHRPFSPSHTNTNRKPPSHGSRSHWSAWWRPSWPYGHRKWPRKQREKIW